LEEGGKEAPPQARVFGNAEQRAEQVPAGQASAGLPQSRHMGGSFPEVTPEESDAWAHQMAWITGQQSDGRASISHSSASAGPGPRDVPIHPDGIGQAGGGRGSVSRAVPFGVDIPGLEVVAGNDAWANVSAAIARQSSPDDDPWDGGVGAPASRASPSEAAPATGIGRGGHAGAAFGVGPPPFGTGLAPGKESISAALVNAQLFAGAGAFLFRPTEAVAVAASSQPTPTPPDSCPGEGTFRRWAGPPSSSA